MPASTACGATTSANALWRDRTLVKTWAMRGTLHLVAVGRAAGAGRRARARGSTGCGPLWLRYFEVTREEMLALQDGIGEVLTRHAR